MEDVNKANDVRDMVLTTLRKGIGFLSYSLW
jgi:hypothetical protein